ncbi:MAG: peptide chain release factor N(5)-glutamine methyltransferase [Alphaproteobacteria bacterium]|nr:peptide chain release factor N(5)-glutamine methyltransferase [Alphaproteobacteria bacterium]
MTETLEAIVAATAAVLAGAGRVEPRRLARRLVASSLDLSPAELLTHSKQAIGSAEAARVRRLVRRVAQGEPLSRAIGRREFWGLDFALSPETLDPRPESETLIEGVLARVSDRAAGIRVLDLGTGTGCLLLALLTELPAAFGIGVDVHEGAVATARQNAQALGLAGRASFFVGDWGTAIGQPFDVVVANPPYIPTSALPELPREVREYDPQRALEGGEDGLAAYRKIASQLHALLAPFALFAGEIGIGQALSVEAILRDQGLSLAAIQRDLAGIERCVVARASADRVILGQKNLGMCPRHV